MDDFEGLSENYIRSNLFSNDIMLVSALILLSAFAWIFRVNAPLFGKMLSNISAGEQRQSIFNTTEKDSFLFNTFMTFQTLLLLSIFTFSVAVKFDYFPKPDIGMTWLSLGIFFFLFLIYYLFKMGLYAIFGAVFIENSTNKMIFTNYQALFCIWGVSIYLPVFWILLFDVYLFLPIIFLILSILILKAILVFRFFNIFVNKNTGFLFFSLYLCAQEMVPLVLLFQGLTYIFKVPLVFFYEGLVYT
jgi:hypothetical protein